MSQIDIVKSCPLFFELYDDEIDSILKKCYVIQYSSSKLIIKEGDEGKDFFVIVQGKVEVSKQVAGRKIRIAVLEKGDVFGEFVLINERKRRTSISALDSCDILVVDHDTIFSLFQNNPKIFSILMMNMARLLARRLRHSNRAINSMYKRVKNIT